MPSNKLHKNKEVKTKKTYFLSFYDMQRLHNSNGIYKLCPFSHRCVISLKGEYNETDTIKNLFKIVKRTSLQYVKKLKQFKCQCNWVEFV